MNEWPDKDGDMYKYTVREVLLGLLAFLLIVLFSLGGCAAVLLLMEGPAGK